MTVFLTAGADFSGRPLKSPFESGLTIYSVILTDEKIYDEICDKKHGSCIAPGSFAGCSGTETGKQKRKWSILDVVWHTLKVFG